MTDFSVRIWRGILWLVLTMLVLAAIVITGLRFVLPHLNDYRQPISHWLSEQTHMTIQVSQIEGHWYASGPELYLHNVDVSDDANSPQLLHLGNVRVQMNLWQSLWHFHPVFDDIQLSHLNIDLIEFSPHWWSSEKSSGRSQHDVAEKLNALLLMRLANFSVMDSQVKLTVPSGKVKTLNIDQLRWQNDRRTHLIEGRISVVGSQLNHLQIIANLSELNSLSQLRGQIYVKGENISLVPWLSHYIDKKTQLTPSHINFESWLDLAHGRIEQVMIQANKGYLGWQRDGRKHQTTLKTGLLVLSPILNHKAWMVQAENIVALTDKKAWPKLHVAAFWSPEQWRLNVSQVQLSALSPWIDLFSLPPLAREWMSHLQPKGALKDIRVLGKPNQPPDFSLQFSHVALKQWALLPGIHRLSGVIAGNMAQGHVTLDLNHDVLPYGSVFQAPLIVNQGAVNAYWKMNKKGWSLWSDHVDVKTPDLNVNGVFRLDVPVNQSPWLSFYAKADLKDAGSTWRYLPRLALGNKLTRYLSKALQAGQAQHAQLLWYGRLSQFPYAHHQGIFQAQVPLTHTRFHFGDGWPVLTDVKLDLLFQNDRLFLNGSHANTLGAIAHRITGEADLTANGQLKLAISASALGADVTHYMDNSPLKASVGAALQQVNVRGPIHANFQLLVPFDDAPVKAWGNAQFLDNQVRLKTPQLTLNHVRGSLFFDNAKLRITDLSATLFHQPVRIDLTGKNTSKAYQLGVNVSGVGRISDLPESIKPLVAPYVSGVSDWQTQVRVNISPNDVAYKVHGMVPLSKLSTHLPYPLMLSSGTSETANIWVSGNGRSLKTKVVLPQLSYQANISLTSKTPTITTSLLQLGHQMESVPFAQLQGNRIDADCAKLNLDHWFSVISKFDHAWNLSHPIQKKSLSNQSIAFVVPMPTNVSTQIGQLTLGGLLWKDVNVIARREGNRWTVYLASKETQGKVVWQPNVPLNIHLSSVHFSMPPFRALTTTSETSNKMKTLPVNPEWVTPFDRKIFLAIPDVTLAIDDAWVQGRQLGTVHGRLRRQYQSLVLQSFTIKSKALSLDVLGRWDMVGNRNYTRFKLDLNGKNTSNLMALFGVSDGIQDAPFDSYVSAEWNGTPWAINRSSINGKVNTHLGEGVISHAGNGVSRFLGFFSLDSLLRRLRLDFSDVFEDGLAFDSIHGSGVIKNGIFHTNNLTMKALAGNMSIQGSTNLINDTVDARVKFIPDLTSGIPLLAAFAVAPQSALYVWAASTLLAPFIDVFTQINYSVTGSMFAPKITELSRNKGHYQVPTTSDEVREHRR